MQIYKLRPHHILCMRFFEGKGYSPEFTENMRNIIHTLENTDPYVIITVNTDMICAKCPNNINNICVSDKVKRYDKKIMNICGYHDNCKIRYNDLKKSAENIISCGIENICGDCQWFYICKK